MKVVVTGASGFVGQPLCAHLKQNGHEVTAVVRRGGGPAPMADRLIAAGDLSRDTDWSEALQGADAVVHLAARTHVLGEETAAAEHLYEASNLGVTEGLAMAARAFGVRRVVYVSSIKVNGERTFGVPFRPQDTPAPETPYGRTKAAAERCLREFAGEDLETVILRPPLMYGPGVRGNVEQLYRWAKRGVPLPIGSIANKRDLLGVTSFVDLIARALISPAANGRIFLARDGAAVSTPDLYREIAESLGRNARIVSCPVKLLDIAASLAGARERLDKLTGDLEIDDSETRRILDWRPAVDMKTELAAAAREFMSRG